MIVDNLFENHTAVNTAQAIARELHATLMDLVNIGQAKSQQGAGHPEYAAKLRQEAIALAGDLERLGYEFDFKSPGYIRPLTVDNQPQRKVTEMQCPECGGAAFTDLILAEKKDACYYKVKASAKVWPSAYASGRLVQCRKRGAANYGNKSRNEDVTDTDKSRQPVRPNTPPQPIKKRPATPFGPGTQVNEFAPGGHDSGDDGFSEETLKRLAAQWYNGDEDPEVEKTLAAAGWEIGQDEGYDDEPGVFVVLSGDVNGNSYISWPAHELKQGVAEMDKSQPSHGRDGKISHSTYGSRDKKGSDDFKGKEAPGKAITAKQASKDALDILKKQGVAEDLNESFSPDELSILNQYLDDEISWHELKRGYRDLVAKTIKRFDVDVVSWSGFPMEFQFYDRLAQARDEGDLGEQGVAEGSLKEFAPGDGNGDGDDNGDSEMQRRLIMLKSLVHLQQDLDPASIQVWYVSRTDMYHASGQRPGEAVVRMFKYTYNPQSKKFTPVTSESLADDFADFARQRGIKVRVAGTPEQERERSRALQAQRAKANELRQREQALADRQQLDDLESKFADMKARYDSLGGSAWQYADREQNLTAAEREARSMESDLNTLYARIQRAKKVDDLNEGPVTDNAVKLIKGLGLAGIKGVQGLWWAVNNPGKALALAAVTTHPKETWNAANFAWNLVTDPGHVVNVLGRRAAADMPIAGKWVDKAQAAQDLQKIMGNTATSDMVFRLADLAVDNALPIAGVIALLYGGHKFIQYLRDRNAIPPGEKAFQRISQELGADRLPKPNSTPTQPPVSEVDVKDQAQPMKLADYLAQAEALQAKLSQAARDNDREVIQQLENQRRELDAQARRGLVPESKKSDDLVGGRHTQDQFDDMIGRLKQLANAGPLKTVWDPQRQVYRNVPVKPKQDKK